MKTPLVGEPTSFDGAPRPDSRTLTGRLVQLRAIDPVDDADALFAASRDPALWTYLPEAPPVDVADHRRMLTEQSAGADRVYYAIVPRETGVAAGQISYYEVVPDHGVIEIGHIWLGPALARTTAATEAIFLTARHAFDDLGYRRLEWKCNALNGPSRAAALRYGFVYEGTFAQHRVVKGRNRDTAWFSITDARWPGVRDAFEHWLAPENFDAAGDQRRRLVEFMPR